MSDKVFMILMGILLVGILYLSVPFSYEILSVDIEACRELADLGYRDYNDRVTHRDCMLTNDTNYGFKRFDTVFDVECVKNIDKEKVAEYKQHCVWGGPAFIKLVFLVGVHAVLIMLFFIIATSIRSSGLEEENKVCPTCGNEVDK